MLKNSPFFGGYEILFLFFLLNKDLIHNFLDFRSKVFVLSYKKLSNSALQHHFEKTKFLDGYRDSSFFLLIAA